MPHGSFPCFTGSSPRCARLQRDPSSRVVASVSLRPCDVVSSNPRYPVGGALPRGERPLKLVSPTASLYNKTPPSRSPSLLSRPLLSRSLLLLIPCLRLPLPLLLLPISQPRLILHLELLHPIDRPRGVDIIPARLPDLELRIEAGIRVRDVALAAHEALGGGAGDAVALHYWEGC